LSNYELRTKELQYDLNKCKFSEWNIGGDLIEFSKALSGTLNIISISSLLKVWVILLQGVLFPYFVTCRPKRNVFVDRVLRVSAKKDKWLQKSSQSILSIYVYVGNISQDLNQNANDSMTWITMNIKKCEVL